MVLAYIYLDLGEFHGKLISHISRICREFCGPTTISQKSCAVPTVKKFNHLSALKRNHSAVRKDAIGSLDKRRRCQVESCTKKCGKGGGIVSHEGKFCNLSCHLDSFNVHINTWKTDKMRVNGLLIHVEIIYYTAFL